MTQYEGFPPTTHEQPSQEDIFYQDGSLNEEVLSELFGIGLEEAMLEVTYGNYSGSVAKMLGDVKCPVGGIVRTAYEEQGLEGVAAKFKALGELEPRFSVNISKASIQREQVKKK